MISVTLAAALSVVVQSAGGAPDGRTRESHNLRELKASLGACIGDDGYDPRWDCNGDGFINALDIRLWQSPKQQLGGGVASGVLTEIVLVEDALTLAEPGTSVTVLMKLFNNEIPLFGYSLAVRAIPLDEAMGTITVDVDATNFFDSQHIILADPGGAPLDKDFAIIQPWGPTGVFINANTDDGSTVQAITDVNDVYAEVHFGISADAAGIFVLELGPATAMSDGNGQPIPLRYCEGRIAVDIAKPSPSDLNGDGSVGPVDLAILLSVWGTCTDPIDCPADSDCDGVVSASDLARLLGDWGG